MSLHLRSRESLLVVFVLMLALLPAVTAAATSGVMYVTADTTLTEDHNGPIEITADNVTLDCAGYKVTGSGSGDGIRLSDRSGVTVRNCDVSGFQFGIHLADASLDNTISNNVVTHNQDKGIHILGDPIVSSGNTIDGNTVADNGRVGIYLGNTHSNTLIGNTVERNAGSGFAIYGDNNTLADNTAERNAGGGFAIYGVNNLLIDNAAERNTGGGFVLHESAEFSSLHGNTATGNDLQGFLIAGGSTNWLARNVASGNSSGGFIVDRGNGNTLIGNLASGNTASGFGVFNGGPNYVENNHAHRNGEWGFESADNSGVVRFLDNHCVDNVNDGSNPSGLCDESGHFTDDDGNQFEVDIEWMKWADITRGCNPPVNDRYCPNSTVTRGQMAAFLTRALELPAASSAGFVDTVGSTFESDIDRLAAAGITGGCNPPANDRFCPDDPVRREVMAAFLVRALGYTDDGGGDLFTDDDDSIFESDIDRLATAGVTRGCNPPVNDRFCPTSNVTRGQMAAFLHRALG